VGVGESLTNWLLWAWDRVWQNGYCGLEVEIYKLVFVGEDESLTNWLLRAWWWLTKWLLLALGRDYQTSFCGRGG
jgi:hypothetical protein